MKTVGRTEPEASTVLAAESSFANSLEQVREILVGPQHREIARRLARADARVSSQGDEIRNDTRRRLDALEAYIQKESEALTAAIDTQRSAQIEALNNVAHEAHEATLLLEQRLKKVEEAMTRVQRDFRQQLLEQATSFIDEVQRTRAELTATVERELVWGEPAAEEEKGEEEEDRGEQRERPSEAA